MATVAQSPTAAILDKALEGERITPEDALALLESRDRLGHRRHGNPQLVSRQRKASTIGDFDKRQHSQKFIQNTPILNNEKKNAFYDFVSLLRNRALKTQVLVFMRR